MMNLKIIHTASGTDCPLSLPYLFIMLAFYFCYKFIEQSFDSLQSCRVEEISNLQDLLCLSNPDQISMSWIQNTQWFRKEAKIDILKKTGAISQHRHSLYFETGPYVFLPLFRLPFFPAALWMFLLLKFHLRNRNPKLPEITLRSTNRSGAVFYHICYNVGHLLNKKLTLAHLKSFIAVQVFEPGFLH